MLNGAQTIDKKALLNIHKFQKGSWNNFQDIKLDLDDEQDAYMLECPNYLKIADKEFLIACLEKQGNLESGSHFVQYRQVDIDQNFNIKFKTPLIKLDYDYDFYAPQIFNNLDNRKIMIGWLGNSQSNPLPSNLTTWSHQLSIPRELTFKNNQIHQLPIKELENLRIEKLESQNSIFKYEEGLCEIEAGNLNSDFEIVINNNQNESIKIYAKKSKLIVDRGLTSFQDEINLPTIVTIDNVEIKSIRILIDRSAMEIFVNDGQYAMSVRFYLDKHNQIFTNINELEVYQLKGYSYQWNNIIFENKLKEI